MASRLFPGQSPAQVVGQGVRIGWLGGSVISEVVGVIESVRSRRVDTVPDPEVYVPFAQVPAAAMSYVVRGAGDVLALSAPIREEVARAAPGVPLAAVRTLEDVVSTSTRMSRLISWLSVIFGVLAAALARGNPLSYVVSAERALLAGDLASMPVLLGFVAAVVLAAIGLTVGIRMMRKAS